MEEFFNRDLVMGKVSENILKVGFRSCTDLLILQIWRLRQWLKNA